MKYIIYLGVALGVITVLWYGANLISNESKATLSFEECVAKGNPVMESYPRQCIDKAGNHHTEDVTKGWEATYTNASEEMIRNVNIKVGDTISSPLTVTGEARGYWFFEASFPIAIVDWDGLIIAEGIATAEDDWMTEEFVPFVATIEFETPPPVTPVNRGTIILTRDNPSGLPENDGALEIPILFQ